MIENSQHSGMKTICIEPFIFSYSVNDPDRLREQREGGKREEDDCGVGVLYEHEAEVVFHANTMNKTFCNTIKQIAAHTQKQFLQIKNGFWKYKVSFKRKGKRNKQSIPICDHCTTTQKRAEHALTFSPFNLTVSHLSVQTSTFISNSSFPKLISAKSGTTFNPECHREGAEYWKTWRRRKKQEGRN